MSRRENALQLTNTLVSNGSGFYHVLINSNRLNYSLYVLPLQRNHLLLNPDRSLQLPPVALPARHARHADLVLAVLGAAVVDHVRLAAVDRFGCMVLHFNSRAGQGEEVFLLTVFIDGVL